MLISYLTYNHSCFSVGVPMSGNQDLPRGGAIQLIFSYNINESGGSIF